MSSDAGPMWGQLILLLVLILVNAYFAAAEIAIVSVNKNRVRSLAQEGNKKAETLAKLIEDPNKFLSAIQVVITPASVVSIACSSRPALTSTWLSTAMAIPMPAILKIMSISISFPFSKAPGSRPLHRLPAPGFGTFFPFYTPVPALCRSAAPGDKVPAPGSASAPGYRSGPAPGKDR